MDRSPPETAAPRHAGLYERQPVAREPRRARAPRQDEPRFDAMAYRQASGIVRERPEDEDDLPIAASTSGAAVAGRTRRYLAVWFGLGLISAGYLGGVVWQRLGAIDMALAPVTETLERLAIEIAEIRQTTAAIDARGRQTSARLTQAETRLDGFAQAAANLPAAAGVTPTTAPQAVQGQRPTNRAALEATPAPTHQAKAPEPVTTQRVVGIEVVQRPGPMAPTKQIATVTAPVAPSPPAIVRTIKVTPAPATVQPAEAQSVQANPINTGSVAPIVVPSRPSGLLVASGPSLDSIRLSWDVLSQNHGAVLGSLEPRILPAGDGSAFQLIAGPFASDAEAQKACSALKARGVGCRPAEYAGAPL